MRSNTGLVLARMSAWYMMTLTCSVVSVSVSRTILATECASMDQQEVEQLRERQDYNEGFDHPQSPPSPSSYVYLLACQPYSQKKGILHYDFAYCSICSLK